LATNTILGGAQVQLSQADILSDRGIMGNVYGPGGGFKDSPLAGSQVRTQSDLAVSKANLGEPDPLRPLSDFAIIKTAAPVSPAAIAAAVASAPEVSDFSSGGAGDASGGDGPGPGGAPGGGPGDAGD
jgi:hypothetical protein